MFDFDAERLRGIIREIARSNISTDAWSWLLEKQGSQDTATINTAFSLTPRKTGKERITLSAAEQEAILQIKPGYSIKHWTADQLCRVFLLMHIHPQNEEKYFRTIENLFLAADMTELVALYSALPVLAYAEGWKMRCAEGIRSNMAPVLESIMYYNPYPAAHLDEKAWNQLVLKAFFTDKDVMKIYGFDERANLELAFTLSDYAHERWAAGRPVNPLLWRATTKFIGGPILLDLKKVFEEGDLNEKRAAALAIYNSSSAEVRQILEKDMALQEQIVNGKLNWSDIQQKHAGVN